MQLLGQPLFLTPAEDAEARLLEAWRQSFSTEIDRLVEDDEFVKQYVIALAYPGLPKGHVAQEAALKLLAERYSES